MPWEELIKMETMSAQLKAMKKDLGSICLLFLREELRWHIAHLMNPQIR
jgi:hypothetical protein